MGATYCGHCGEQLSAEATPVVEEPATPVVEEGALRLSRNQATAADHRTCRQRLRLEPPRFCAACRRRMKVQVLPSGWSATCVEHGTVLG